MPHDLLGLAAQHRVGLAHAGAHAEEDLEPSAPTGRRLALEVGEQGVGVRSFVSHRCKLADRGW